METQTKNPQILNPYSYAKNNPISNLDTYGLSPTSFWDVADSLIYTVKTIAGSTLDELAETNGDISEIDFNHIQDDIADAVEIQSNTGLDTWANTVEALINSGNYQR